MPTILFVRADGGSFRAYLPEVPRVADAVSFAFDPGDERADTEPIAYDVTAVLWRAVEPRELSQPYLEPLVLLGQSEPPGPFIKEAIRALKMGETP